MQYKQTHRPNRGALERLEACNEENSSTSATLKPISNEILIAP